MFKSLRLSLLVTLITLGVTTSTAFAYQQNNTEHTITLEPSRTPATTTADIRNAFNFAIKRTDRTTPWTIIFKPGKYYVTGQISVNNLTNTEIRSENLSEPAQLIKNPGWNSANSGEFLLNFRMGSKIKVIGLEFYGQTDFAKNANPYWPDQGVQFASCNIIRIEGNKFANFGNAALRVVTDARDPVRGVNSFKTHVLNNTFDNIYQTATTATDKLHGGTAYSTWDNNTFTRLRGSIKFASRTAGAKTIEFINNKVDGGDHYGLEIDNYDDFLIQNNSIRNIKEYAITIYTNGDGSRMEKGFPWGNNFSLIGNHIKNVGNAIRYAHNPFWDGTQNIPKNLVIQSNLIEDVASTYRQMPAISITGSIVNGLTIKNNQMNRIQNRSYISFPRGCTGLSILDNTVDGNLLK